LALLSYPLSRKILVRTDTPSVNNINGYTVQLKNVIVVVAVLRRNVVFQHV
jgi:hypothetical protein